MTDTSSLIWIAVSGLTVWLLLLTLAIAGWLAPAWDVATALPYASAVRWLVLPILTGAVGSAVWQFISR